MLLSLLKFFMVRYKGLKYNKKYIKHKNNPTSFKKGHKPKRPFVLIPWNKNKHNYLSKSSIEKMSKTKDLNSRTT